MNDAPREDAAGTDQPSSRPESVKKAAYLAGVGLLVALPTAYLVLTIPDWGSPPTPPATQPTSADVEAQIVQSRQLVAADPTEVNYINLSLALIRAQRYTEGIEACHEALAINPRSVRALNNLGFAQLMSNQFAEAEASLGKALEFDPTFDLARNNLTLLRTEKDKIAKVIADLRASLQASPSFDSYFRLGHQYYLSGMFREAVEATVEALRWNDQSAEAYNNLCASYNALKEWDAAIRACQRAVALKPDFALAKNNLALAQSNR